MQTITMNDFSRQVNIFKPEEFKTPIHIIGAGATGSWLAFSLAKMGIENITVYDFDEVGMHNLPNQMFGLRHIDTNKAVSIKRIIKQFTGFDIKAQAIKVDGTRPMQGIVFVLTDTMKSRVEIYNKAIRNNPFIDLLIETRMDLRGGRIYALNPKDKTQDESYIDTFYSDDESEVSACGVSQTVLPSALAITSHAIWKMLNYINGEDFPNETILDFSNEIIMTQTWESKLKLRKKIDLIGKVIHCETEEQAIELLAECRKQGINWSSGREPSGKYADNWDRYEKNMCYYINKPYNENDKNLISYSGINYYKENEYDIYKFEEIFR